MTETDSDLEALRMAVLRFAEVCGPIADADWSRPTPCVDWSLQGLVDHVVGGNRFTMQILGGATADAALADTMASFADGGATSSDAVSSSTEMVDAFEQSGVLDRVCHHVAGDLTGREVLRLRTQDLIVHTWDVGQSLGVDSTVPTELIEWGSRELADSGSLTVEHFGMEATRPGDISTAESRYLAAFGR